MVRSGKKYSLTYDDSKLPKHYGWKIESRLDAIEQAYKAAIAGLSYLRARLWPRRREANLEDFLVNRFGHFLYDRFFRE